MVYVVDIITLRNSTIMLFPNINVESDSMRFPVSADFVPKPISLTILIKLLSIILDVAHSFGFALNFQIIPSKQLYTILYYIQMQCDTQALKRTK